MYQRVKGLFLEVFRYLKASKRHPLVDPWYTFLDEVDDFFLPRLKQLLGLLLLSSPR